MKLSTCPAHLRIAYVTPGLTWVPGGSHRVAYEHANHLQSRGHSVHIIHPPVSTCAQSKARTPDALARFGRLAVSFRKSLAHARPSWFALHPNVTATKLRNWDANAIPSCDVIIASNWHIAPQVFSIAKLLAVPMLQLAHHYEVLSGYSREAVHAALSLPTRLVAVSSWTQAVLRDAGFPNAVHCPNGVDPHTYRLITPPLSRGPTACANYIDKRIKDPQTLVAALSAAKRKLPNLAITLFGTSKRRPTLPFPFTYLSRHADDFLASNVFNQCSVFVSSSLVEGFGLLQAEAMACGCALVCTDSGGISDFAIHNTTALLSAPGDHHRLAHHLLLALGDAALRERLVANGLAVMRDFTWSRSAEILEQILLAEVAANAARARPQ